MIDMNDIKESRQAYDKALTILISYRIALHMGKSPFGKVKATARKLSKDALHPNAKELCRKIMIMTNEQISFMLDELQRNMTDEWVI